jgi:hypothetical protein
MNATLFILGSSVFIILGIGHAVLLLFTAKFEPKDAALLVQLKTSKTGMSNTGNIWRGIKGFHLSHSLGMVIYGAFYTTLAIENINYLKSSTALNLGLVVVPATYVYLAQSYWFNLPRNCLVVATCLLTASIFVR